MPVLPPVPPWSGQTAVSPSIISVIRSMGTSSSSATIWRIAARCPVPRSTLPVKRVIVSSAWIARNAST
jgi:hypothetical protein